MYKFGATMYWHTYKLQATIGLLPAMLDQNSTTPLTDGTRKHTHSFDPLKPKNAEQPLSTSPLPASCG
jgi:hypothetical protein